MVAPLIAVKAYSAAQSMGAGALGATAGPAAGPDFGHMVGQAMNQAMTDTRSAETQMTSQVQGKSSLVDVVTSISQAQTSLNAMIAVRNQMITSYQQIMNMQI
jgi:flagellar hook-basal body complex protein FliE